MQTQSMKEEHDDEMRRWYYHDKRIEKHMFLLCSYEAMKLALKRIQQEGKQEGKEKYKSEYDEWLEW